MAGKLKVLVVESDSQVVMAVTSGLMQRGLEVLYDLYTGDRSRRAGGNSGTPVDVVGGRPGVSRQMADAHTALERS